ncbi:MAG TPA: class I SAM-dependent methyltransferase [Candidatus Avacidaminococcus intestinavium]|uniref:Class I SAM-dependent methyltransferase n=1 Tax=Candidatus Avacidaminococcus intestinavium TaxID=2840684 RepID=A0A9D1MNS3_9FIRM|nr:class I SAM-dependent methyltransferase [Candidatus Avacidaminococcus intestinavium]
MLDLIHFTNLWSEIRGTQKESEAYWDGRADFFNNMKDLQERKQRQSTVINKLIEKNIINEHSLVLDIGCSVGNYTVDFAKKTKHATGTDISGKALTLAENYAHQQGVNNITFVKSDWQDILLSDRGWEKHFDLVFAAMCPGISNRKTLEKMTEASKGYCLLSMFASREDSVRNELARLCGLQSFDLHHTGNSIYCIFNILWLLGLYPEIRLENSTWENTFSLEDAIKHYTSMLGGTALTAEHKIIIRKYLASHAEDNIITEKISSKIAWIGWEAN